MADAEPLAAPSTPLSRATTVTLVNPTPPTNIPAYYQGSPPTDPSLLRTAAGAAAPDVSVSGIFLFADPANGALKTGASAPTELAGKAEGDGTEATLAYDGTGGRPSHGRLSPRATDGNFSETPNASHPSYGT